MDGFDVCTISLLNGFGRLASAKIQIKEYMTAALICMSNIDEEPLLYYNSGSSDYDK